MNIVHAIGIRDVGMQRVAAAFTTIDGLRSWWTIHVAGDPKPGGQLEFGFPNAGPVVQVIEAGDTGLQWRCIDGPQEWIGTEIIVRFFDDRDETQLMLTHAGWLAETVLMHHCSSQWAYFLFGLKRWLEGGDGAAFGANYEPISARSPQQARVSSSRREPRDLVRALYQTLMARGDVEAADELLAPDYIDHDIPGHVGDGGRDELKQAVLGVRSSFSDIQPRLLHVFSHGDFVCVRVEAFGAHTGASFMGFPPTGRPITWREIHVFRCADGQTAEHWGVFDLLSIQAQLQSTP